MARGDFFRLGISWPPIRFIAGAHDLFAKPLTLWRIIR
jgi:hypothetical protein